MLPGIILLIFILFIMAWLVYTMLPKVVELNTEPDKQDEETDIGYEIEDEILGDRDAELNGAEELENSKHRVDLETDGEAESVAATDAERQLDPENARPKAE